MARELSVVFSVMDAHWDWGVSDCCTAACDAFEKLHGIDPMTSLRGKYNSQLGAAKEIQKRGGFIKMCETLAFEAKLEEGSGKAGEIGIACCEDGSYVLAVAIADNTWAAKTENGFVTLNEAIMSWACRRQ